MSQEYAAPADVYGQTGDVTTTRAAAPLFTRLSAEAVGTFMVVLGILSTATFGRLTNQSGLAVALAAGLMLVAAYASFGHVSGGHFNPAVTFGSAVAGRSSWRDLLPYWLAQFVGASASAVVVWAILPEAYGTLLQIGTKDVVIAQAANGFAEHSQLAIMSGGQVEFSLVSALLVEIIIAAVFVGVFLAVTAKATRAQRAGVGAALGLALAGLHLIAWPVTNVGLNPARSFASALFAADSGIWGQYWLFFVAPIVGAGLAALFARAFAPLAPVASEEAIEQIEETYEIAPAAAEEPAAVEEPAAAAAVTPEATEADAAAETDEVAAPEGSTPDKPQA